MKITTVETRLSKDVKFFEFPDNIRLYVEEIYLKTGKLLSAVFEYSQDELVKTRIYEFRSKEDLMDFRNDAFLNQLRSEKSEYEEKNSITVRFVNID
jgi:hypothetical protein